MPTGFIFFVVFISNETQINGTHFSSFVNHAHFWNTGCTGRDNVVGTCLKSESDCSAKLGTSIGPCANGSGTCCAYKFTCDQVLLHNETVFVNPSYPRGDNLTEICQVTINPIPDVCQIRLDFELFNLAQPDVNGLCTTDAFVVRTTSGEKYPILCGENEGNHMYINLDSQSVILSVAFDDKPGTGTTRKWRILMRMIECNSLLMAPSGCLQFHRTPSAVFRSFNFGPSIEGRSRYLANLQYTACVRVEKNFCAIRWTTDSPDGFTFGSPLGFDVTESTGLTGQDCSSDDFVGIDQASTSGDGPGEDRFCGSKLAQSHFVVSKSKPFQLKIWSNSNHQPNLGKTQRGFSLRYQQLPCLS